MDEFLSEIYIEVFKQWILMQSNKNLAISLSDDYKRLLLRINIVLARLIFII